MTRDQQFQAMPFWEKIIEASDYGYEMMAGSFFKLPELTPDDEARILAKFGLA